MKKKTIEYHRKGYNCTQCILKAASEQYGFPLSTEALRLCSCTGNGFGVGSICGVLVGAVMVLGLLFPEERAKRLRMRLFMGFQEKWNTLNCCQVCAQVQDCEVVIGFVACLLEELIAVENGMACPICKKKEKQKICENK